MWSRSLLQRLSTTGTWLGASAAPRTWRLSCFVKHNLAILRHKGALTEEALRLVCMSERCSSMMLHVDASALALAALWGDDAEARRSTMANFRTVWIAYARARAMALPSSNKHAQRSPMATLPMGDFAPLGRFYGWGVDAAGALSTRLRKVSSLAFRPHTTLHHPSSLHCCALALLFHPTP